MSSTALTGTIAAAMRYVAKSILIGNGVVQKFLYNFDIPTLRENATQRVMSTTALTGSVAAAMLSQQRQGDG
jgi:hypothetical protein